MTTLCSEASTEHPSKRELSVDTAGLDHLVFWIEHDDGVLPCALDADQVRRVHLALLDWLNGRT